MNTEKLLKDLKQEVASLEQQAQEAVRRREIAAQEATNLEDRNRVIIDTVEAEVAVRRQALDTDFKKQKQELQKEITSLQTVKAQLLDTVEGQNSKVAKLNTKLDELEVLLATASRQVTISEQHVAEMEDALDDGRDEVHNLEAHHAELTKQVEVLDTKRQDVNTDISALQKQANQLQEDITQMEELHQTRQVTFQKQIGESEKRLKVALLKIRETEKQDELMRNAWAEERLKLDNREKVVRKRESLMSDSETRLQQHEEFMKI